MGLKIVCDDEEIKKFPIDEAADAVCSLLGQTEKLSIELSFLSEEEIRSLNRDHRNTDRVTDVLSFPYLDGIRGKVLREKDYPDDIDEETGTLFIGSVCICLKRAEEQAEEYGHSLKREVTYLAVHGFLHCFGYDHVEKKDEEEMTALAEKVMDRIGLQRL